MQDPAPLFVQGAVVYTHIRYAPFVALEIIGGAFMGFLSKLRLYSECFKIGKFVGLIACSKYLCGRLQLEDLTSKSSEIPVGASYE